MPAVPTRYGLANIGNTCYINAAIQMLRSVPEFVSLLKQRTDKAQNNANADQMLLRELKRTIEEL